MVWRHEVSQNVQYINVGLGINCDTERQYCSALTDRQTQTQTHIDRHRYRHTDTDTDTHTHTHNHPQYTLTKHSVTNNHISCITSFYCSYKSLLIKKQQHNLELNDDTKIKSMLE